MGDTQVIRNSALEYKERRNIITCLKGVSESGGRGEGDGRDHSRFMRHRASTIIQLHIIQRDLFYHPATYLPPPLPPPQKEGKKKKTNSQCSNFSLFPYHSAPPPPHLNNRPRIDLPRPNKIIRHRKETHRPHHQQTIIHRPRHRLHRRRPETKQQHHSHIHAPKRIDDRAKRLPNLPRAPGQMVGVGGVFESVFRGGVGLDLAGETAVEEEGVAD